MAKKIVEETFELIKITEGIKFTVTDGIEPTVRRSDGTFELRSPYGFVLRKGQELKLDLGVRCNHAMHVFPAWELNRSNINLVDGIWAAQDADPERNLVLVLKNNSNEDYFVERGHLLARCASLAANSCETRVKVKCQ